MFMNPTLRILIALSFVSSGLQAADAPSAESKLREALRATTLQLRTAETDRANIQSKQAESEQQTKDLNARIEALVKQASEDKKTQDDLNSKLADQDAALTRLRTDFNKSQDALKQTSNLAQTKEAARVKLTDDVILLQRHVADLQTRNGALYRLGNEILSRYEKFGLGTALTAREPFTGITRTKLENLVQDYQDKLSDQTVAKTDEAHVGVNPKSTQEKKKAGD